MENNTNEYTCVYICIYICIPIYICVSIPMHIHISIKKSIHQPTKPIKNKHINIGKRISQFRLLSRVRPFATPWIAARQASLSITNSQSLLKLMPIELVMPSSHLILCGPLLLLPPIPPSIRVFSSESGNRIVVTKQERLRKAEWVSQVYGDGWKLNFQWWACCRVYKSQNMWNVL